MQPVIFFTDKTMTIIHQGKTDFVDLGTALGKECLVLYAKGKYGEIVDIIAASKLLGNGVEESGNGRILVDGVEMDVELANKVKEFKQHNLPFDYLIKLAKKIDEIDSRHIRTQLYGFLQHNGHPITKDGNFIAYKMVSDDFKDLHTRTIDNSVGQVVTMNRRDCDDNPTQTCSAGLHVAAYDYAHNFGSGNLVLCEVDPRDVVAVPIDYDQKKMRTCRYEVVGLADKPIEEATWDEDEDISDYQHLEDGTPWDLEEYDNITFRGDVFIVEDIRYIDEGVVVDLRSLETGRLTYANLDLTEEYFTIK